MISALLINDIDCFLFSILSRVSQVTKEGKYVQSDVPRQLLYGTMVYVHQTIISDASKALSRVVCIAVRYSCVCRQFGSQDGSSETQVQYQYSVLH